MVEPLNVFDMVHEEQGLYDGVLRADIEQPLGEKVDLAETCGILARHCHMYEA